MSRQIVGPATNVVLPSIRDMTAAGRYSSGDLLLLTSGTWANFSGAVTYAWYSCSASGVSNPSTDANCSVVSGQTTNVYTLRAADASRYLYGSSTRLGSDGVSTTTAYSAGVGPATAGAVNTAPPVLSGTYSYQQTASVTNGTWSLDQGTYTYQWYICSVAAILNPAGDPACVAINSATTSSYQIQASDVGRYLVATVTATSSAAPNSLVIKASNVSTLVTGPAINRVLPTISDSTSANTYASGDILTMSAGGWDNANPTAGFTYQWYACTMAGVTNPATDASCSTVGTNAPTYTIPPASSGLYYIGTVTATGTDGSTTSAVSNESEVAATGKALATSAPVLTPGSGPYVVGMTVLSATTGTWVDLAPSNSFAYQWYACDSPEITDPATQCVSVGSNSPNYLIGTSEGGKFFTVVVTATGTDASTTKAISNSTDRGAVGPAVNDVAPVLTDTTVSAQFQVGDSLSTSTGMWHDSQGNYTYQYYSCSVTAVNPSTSSNCVAIEGATSASYVISRNDAGRYIEVAVTVSGTDGTSTTAFTSASGQVTGPAVVVTAPTISDVTSDNAFVLPDVMQLNAGTWNTTNTGIDPIYTFYICSSNTLSDFTLCQAVTSSTLTLIGDYIGKYVYGAVTETGTNGSTTTAATGPYGPITAPLYATVEPSLADLANAGDFASGDTTSLDAALG